MRTGSCKIAPTRPPLAAPFPPHSWGNLVLAATRSPVHAGNLRRTPRGSPVHGGNVRRTKGAVAGMRTGSCKIAPTRPPLAAPFPPHSGGNLVLAATLSYDQEATN